MPLLAHFYAHEALVSGRGIVGLKFAAARYSTRVRVGAQRILD